MARWESQLFWSAVADVLFFLVCYDQWEEFDHGHFLRVTAYSSQSQVSLPSFPPLYLLKGKFPGTLKIHPYLGLFTDLYHCPLKRYTTLSSFRD